jgi:hypothetical protein
MIRLYGANAEAKFGGALRAPLINVRQCLTPIYLWFPRAEQIQVWAMQQ